MIFTPVLCIIAKSTEKTRRNVRAGRRSTIGNRVYGYNRIRGSNPRLSATSEWTALHSKSPAIWLGISHTTSSFLLSAKSHAGLRCSLAAALKAACARHDAPACYRLFAGQRLTALEIHLVSSLHVAAGYNIACGDFFKVTGVLIPLRLLLRKRSCCAFGIMTAEQPFYRVMTPLRNGGNANYTMSTGLRPCAYYTTHAARL